MDGYLLPLRDGINSFLKKACAVLINSKITAQKMEFSIKDFFIFCAVNTLFKDPEIIKIIC